MEVPEVPQAPNWSLLALMALQYLPVKPRMNPSRAQGMPFSTLPLHNEDKKRQIRVSIAVPEVQIPTYFSATHDVPSACIARTVCGVVGICGRNSCLVGEERESFAKRVTAARSANNAHRVPDRYFVEGESNGD